MTTMFEVGDKVRVKDSEPDHQVRVNGLKKGKVYTVLNVDRDILTVNNGYMGCYGHRFEHTDETDYTLKKFEKDIRKFNERCGNVDCTPEMSLAETCATVLPQAKVILEEAKELLKACEEQDEQEILDGSIDVLVTSLRLLSLLGKRYDLMKVAELVMENNHLKYTDDVKLLEQWVVASPPDIYGESSERGGKKYYYLKDLNGKIRKWPRFPKVELNVEELRK